MSRLPVSQKDAAGCGIACLAFALQQTYDDTCRLAVRFFASARGKGLYCKHIVEFFRQSGIEAEYWYVTKRRRRHIYADGTIVFIGRTNDFPMGHYLCRWRGKWMDPWINFPSMAPAKAGWRKKLPGRAIYAIYPFPQ